jgi:hypothetical protein
MQTLHHSKIQFTHHIRSRSRLGLGLHQCHGDLRCSNRTYNYALRCWVAFVSFEFMPVAKSSISVLLNWNIDLMHANQWYRCTRVLSWPIGLPDLHPYAVRLVTCHSLLCSGFVQEGRPRSWSFACQCLRVQSYDRLSLPTQ